jgi:hypothetical protein
MEIQGLVQGETVKIAERAKKLVSIEDFLT